MLAILLRQGDVDVQPAHGLAEGVQSHCTAEEAEAGACG